MPDALLNSGHPPSCAFASTDGHSAGGYTALRLLKLPERVKQTSAKPLRCWQRPKFRISGTFRFAVSPRCMQISSQNPLETTSFAAVYAANRIQTNVCE